MTAPAWRVSRPFVLHPDGPDAEPMVLIQHIDGDLGSRHNRPWPRHLGDWRWQCRWVDGIDGESSAWHYDRDDQGFATGYAEAMTAALAHVALHRLHGFLPPRSRREFALRLARLRARRLLRRLAGFRP